MSLSSGASLSPQQINLQIALTCPEGPFYKVGASLLQQQVNSMQVFGNRFTSGIRTGKHQKPALPVYSFSSPLAAR